MERLEFEKRTMNESRLRSRGLLAVLLAHVLVVGVVFLDIIGLGVPLLRPVVVIAYLTIVPGLVIATVLDFDVAHPVDLCCYSVGMSLVFLMAVGVAINFLYPLVGIARPMDVLPLLTTIVVSVSALGALAERRGAHELKTLVDSIRPREGFAPIPLALLTLPFLGIIATTILDRYGTNVAVIGLLVVLSLIPFALGIRKVESRWYPLAVWTMALSLVYYSSLADGNYPIETWMPVIVPETGRWVPVIGAGTGHEGLLPQNLIYPAYSILGGITPMTQLEVVNPLIMSLLPVLAFRIYRRYVGSRDAFLAATITMFANGFFAIWMNASRDAIATVFLCLFVLVVFDRRVPSRTRAVVALFFLASASVSHYGVAFIALGAIGGVAGLVTLSHRLGLERRLARRGVFFVSLLFFAGVFIYSWYSFTGGGSKSSLLFSQVSALFEAQSATGSATRSLQLQSPLSVRISKRLYILLTGFMGLGTLHCAYQRLVHRRSVVDDEYLIFAFGLLGALAGTFLPIGAFFGTERVIMITYPVTGLFVFLFLRFTIGKLVSTIRSLIGRRRSDDPVVRGTTRFTLATLVAIFFLINTSFVAAFVPGDRGPSTLPLSQQMQESDNQRVLWEANGCTECDADTISWLIQHRNPSYPVYADVSSGGTEFYAMSLLGELAVSPATLFDPDYELQRQNIGNIWNIQEDGSYYGYAWLFRSNLQSGLVQRARWTTRFGQVSSLRPTLEGSNRIYSTGYSSLHVDEFPTESQLEDSQAPEPADNATNGTTP